MRSRLWRGSMLSTAGGLLIATALLVTVSAPPSEAAMSAATASVRNPAGSTSMPIHMKGTGFFHTIQQGGRWWLVTPAGKAFYSSGVDHVSANPDTDRLTGRCPYCDAIATQYPNVASWAAATEGQLKSWGFNTIGSFSDYATFATSMPYTDLLSMASGNDWFAPSFRANAFAVAASQVAPLANDSNLIGWFTDSELHWGPDWRSPNVVLDDYLALPKGSPGHRIAERHLTDPNGFVSALATRYFSVTSAAIRHYDRHHLILGAKVPAQLIQPQLLQVARRFVDVFSIDDYALTSGLEQSIQQAWPQYLNPAPDLSNIEQIVGKPLMIGEFGFRAADSGLPNTYPPIFPAYPTQADRAAAYRAFVQSMYASPWIVGDAWFEYVDEPSGGRSGDGENSNWGLVNVANVPYQTMVTTAEVVHASAPGTTTSPSGLPRVRSTVSDAPFGIHVRIGGHP